MSLIRPIALSAVLVCTLTIANLRAEESAGFLPWQGSAAAAAKANALREAADSTPAAAAPTTPASPAPPPAASAAAPPAPPSPVRAQKPDLIRATGLGTTIAAPPAVPPTAPATPVKADASMGSSSTDAPSPAAATTVAAEPAAAAAAAAAPEKSDIPVLPSASAQKPAPVDPGTEAKADPQADTKTDTKGDAKTDTKPPAKAEKKKSVPAKQFFGMTKSPAPLAARSIGWYAKGCLAGAKPISIDGPAWQVMRLSRNRNWGHPRLIALVERLASEAKKAGDWPGLLIGDISQPRGGPMITGHKSHQVGLDADIWLTPEPDRRLTEQEREDISATSMLAEDQISVDPKVFGDGQIKLIKRAASYSEVERIFVHPAIKKALCEAAGKDRGWLSKVRPMWGHYYHFHIRIGCPPGQSGCRSQPGPDSGDGCGGELKTWIKMVTPKKDEGPKKPEKPSASPSIAELTMKDLPPECQTVLTAGDNKIDDVAAAAYRDKSRDAGDGSASLAATASGSSAAANTK